MKAIITAAGLGTRFLPATHLIPKEVLPVLDQPVIEHVVREALDAPACDECIVVTSTTKPLIEATFTPDPAFSDMLRARGKNAYAEAVDLCGSLSVSFVYQEAPLGLGHAVLQAAPHTCNDPFYVLLGDVIVPEHTILPKLRSVSETHGGASVIALIPVAEEEVSRFGIAAGTCVGCLDEANIFVSAESQGTTACLQGTIACASASANAPGSVWKISDLVEKPARDQAPSNLAIFGRYLLSARVMELLHTQVPGAAGEIQLTDALQRVLREEDMYAVVIDPQEGYDTGTVATLIAANVRMALADARFADALRESLQDILA